MIAAGSPRIRVAPMPANRRFGIATASSISFHAVLLVVVGIMGASRPSVAPQVLIPIEITSVPAEIKQTPVEATTKIETKAGPVRKITLGGGGDPKGKRSATSTPAFRTLAAKRVASSGGGKLKASPAPPRVLTSKSGIEPSGPIGQGRDPAGPGGQEDAEGGPSYGPGIAGGGGPLAVYPKNALDQDLEGAVSLAVLVGSDGTIKSVTVAKSSGHKLLDDAALRAIKSGWTFRPGMQKGKPAADKVTVTFVFSGGSVKRG